MPSIGSLCVVSYYSFIFLCYNRSPEKWRFLVLKSLLSVFNLKALDWVHCEEETGAYYQLSQNFYKLFLFSVQIFKVYFVQKTLAFKKIAIFFFKWDNLA